MASLHAPLPTLRRPPHEGRRTARGQCGSLHLHCRGLPPLTPCRSPGALPARLATDTCPLSGAQGTDDVWSVGQEVPGLLAGGVDSRLVVPGDVGEFVVPKIAPDVLHRVELR